MRRWIVTFLILSTTPSALLAATTDIKVMSFNVRTANAADGANDWDGNRKNIVVQAIRDYAPDLLGIQEDLKRQKDFLDGELTSFDSIGKAVKGGTDGEYVSIFYRKSRFTLLDSGHFWLSETPNVVASESWGTSLPRKVTWGEFRDNNNPLLSFVFMNTHWDHVSSDARLESATLMRQKIPELATDMPVIFTGDFNADQGGAAYQRMTGRDNFDNVRNLVDTYREIHPENSATIGTAPGFDGTGGSGRIDWILHDNDFTTIDAAVIRKAYDGFYPSDHLPITATIRPDPIPEPSGAALIGMGAAMLLRRTRRLAVPTRDHQ
jgi:endonuclease/exonuclease/phosphatase family metal-dependent hydrolase